MFMYDSPIFLDCCGLVRQALRDMKVHITTLNPHTNTTNSSYSPSLQQDDLGFTTGPWNQAYQLDTLPIRVSRRVPPNHSPPFLPPPPPFPPRLLNPECLASTN